MKTLSFVLSLGVVFGVNALSYNESEAYVEINWAGAAYCCGTLGNG